MEHPDFDTESPRKEEVVKFGWKLDFEQLKRFCLEKADASPIFVGGPKGGHEWQLQMLIGSGRPGYEGNFVDDDVGLYVKLISIGKGINNAIDEVPVRVEFDFIFTQGPFENRKFNAKENPEPMSVGKCVGAATIVELDLINQTIGRLGLYAEVKIICTLWIKHPLLVTTDTILNEYRRDRQLSSLTTFYNSLLEDSFADLTVQMGSEVCRVHKCILAGRSNVFAAMFSSGMLEASTSTVPIDDFRPEIVKAMINYIYCGDISAAKENPCDMLRIADKYELLELKDECEKLMVSTLTAKNAGQALQCAYEHNLEKAMAEIKKFVVRNRTELSQTGSLSEVIHQYPELVLELFLSK